MKKIVQQKLLQVAQLGNAILRKRAIEISNVQSKDVQVLITDLVATLMDANGVGIAAPQVYTSIRLFILASHPNPRYPKAPMMKPTAVVNPNIVSFSGETQKDWEGCLSIPGIRALVPRSKAITVEYTTGDGRKVKRRYTDFVARIFQHEYDHLEGKVFLDRVEDTKEIVTEKEYLKIISKKTS